MPQPEQDARYLRDEEDEVSPHASTNNQSGFSRTLSPYRSRREALIIRQIVRE